MDKQQPNAPDACDVFIIGFVPMLLYGLCVVPPAGMIVISLVVGPLCIWRAVRWLNRRDDSRYAHRPPDPP